MELKQYLKLAKSTAVYPKIIVLSNPTEDQIKRCNAVGVELNDITWVYPLIGLFGEAGELANKLKKVIRDDGFDLSSKLQEIIDEKGDLAWYNIILDKELGLDPDLVLKLNIEKLRKRKQNNTIHDTGQRILSKVCLMPKTTKISKLVYFMETMKWFEGPEKAPVRRDNLIKELVKSKRFTLKEAEKYIKKLQRSAVIYESKPNMYNLV